LEHIRKSLETKFTVGGNFGLLFDAPSRAARQLTAIYPLLRQAGEKGWGQKVIAIWRWKNELPAIYPEEIFYGKIPAGRAALMSTDYLRVERYPRHHRPLRKCSALAQRIYERLRLDPPTTGSLRMELNMRGRPERNRFDRALQELQVTLNIARRNSLEDEMILGFCSVINISMWCM